MVVFPTNKRFVHPDIVSSHFHLRPGDVVADFGAGVGFFEPALSRAVGEQGRVYACEIQKNLVEKMRLEMQTQRVHNVEPLWCDFEELGGVKIEDGILDAGIIVNTLFQIEDKKIMAQEIARTIRKGGKLFVVDWSESFAGLGPRPNDVVRESEARNIFEDAGFRFERNFDAGEHHYGLAFWRE